MFRTHSSKHISSSHGQLWSKTFQMTIFSCNLTCTFIPWTIMSMSISETVCSLLYLLPALDPFQVIHSYGAVRVRSTDWPTDWLTNWLWLTDNNTTTQNRLTDWQTHEQIHDRPTDWLSIIISNSISLHRGIVLVNTYFHSYDTLPSCIFVSLSLIWKMENLNEKQFVALEGMRTAFAGAEGHGMPVDDHTFLRYLLAR